MNDRAKLIDQYIDIWNETDASRRRRMIAEAWASDATYLDPMMQAAGHAGIDSMVEGVQARFPNHRFKLLGQIDTHHDCLRFAWELGPEGGPAIVRGSDFVTLTGGRLQAVTGFLDYIAAQ